jgi:hypothetical protein
MNDTVKIERPMSCRRHEDFGGRVKQDPLGNTVKVKTRVHDSEDEFAGSADATATADEKSVPHSSNTSAPVAPPSPPRHP